MRLAWWAGSGVLVVWAMVGTVGTQAYPLGAPAGVTGAAGEETCVKCHNTNALNAGRTEKLGDLALGGFPEKYEPGKAYTVTVELTHEQGRMAFGFQLAARTASGGMQAGALKPVDSHTQLVSDKGLQYIGHTREGTFSNVFEFTWTAPAPGAGDVLVGAAGNAADGDASPVGDFIYSTSVTIGPASK